MTKLAPIKEFTNFGMRERRGLTVFNDVELELVRQAIIRDFVSTLEPVAWTYTKRNGEPTVTLDFNFATIVIGDGFDVTRLFNLSEWSK